MGKDKMKTETLGLSISDPPQKHSRRVFYDKFDFDSKFKEILKAKERENNNKKLSIN